MNLYMLESRFGLADDVCLMHYKAGRRYRIPEKLAQRFEQLGYAISINHFPLWSCFMSSRYKARRVVRVSDPVVEPLTLTEVKTFLRIDHADDDALLTDIIKAARIVAEEQTGRSLITQSWQMSYDGCPPQVVYLAHGPVQSITSVKSMTEDGAETLIDSSHYYINSVQDLVFNLTPSSHQVQITYTAGYGNTASDVPNDICQALLIHIAHLYEHRDAMTPPLASQLNYANHRELRL